MGRSPLAKGANGSLWRPTLACADHRKVCDHSRLEFPHLPALISGQYAITMGWSSCRRISSKSWTRRVAKLRDLH